MVKLPISHKFICALGENAEMKEPIKYLLYLVENYGEKLLSAAVYPWHRQ
jgi:hypothetical protein